MFPLLLLAALGQLPTPIADEWRPLNADPRYEVRGHTEPDGLFRFDPASLRPRSAPRPAPRPVANFGLNLPRETVLSAHDFEVRGTDAKLGRTVADAAIKAERTKAEPPKDTTVGAIISQDGAAPCPGPGPCPVPSPSPHKPLIPRPPTPAVIERDAIEVVALVAAGAIAVFIMLAVFCVGLFFAARGLFRLLSPTP